jgi:hypothetical protein
MEQDGDKVVSLTHRPHLSPGNVPRTKTGHGQHSSRFLICVVLFVILVVLLLIVMFYVLFMCKCVVPPGVNPIAVDKYININIYRYFC